MADSKPKFITRISTQKEQNPRGETVEETKTVEEVRRDKEKVKEEERLQRDNALKEMNEQISIYKSQSLFHIPIDKALILDHHGKLIGNLVKDLSTKLSFVASNTKQEDQEQLEKKLDQICYKYKHPFGDVHFFQSDNIHGALKVTGTYGCYQCAFCGAITECDGISRETGVISVDMTRKLREKKHEAWRNSLGAQRN